MSALLYELAVMDQEKGWTQQFHIGALRNTNTIMSQKLGPDTGFDSTADGEIAKPLNKFFDRLAAEGKLAKTIVYNLNPKDNEAVATMLGSFQDGTVAGKMQYGSGWWFLDQKDGITRQLDTLSHLGLLSRFVGMVTDSRSFLSYPRHEYFRRILCNLLGGEMENGQLPDDPALMGKMVEDICYNNAKDYFGIELD
jgi:glucuronate isomerase